MNIKELRAISRERHNSNGHISYLIFFFTLLAVSGVFAINLFLPILAYFLIPTMVIPLFFACEISIILLRRDRYLTFGGYFRCYFGFFSEHFNSTFGAIKSMLFALAFFGGVLFISLLATSLSMYFSNHLGFREFIHQLMNANTVAKLDELFKTYQPAINFYMMCTTYPSIMVFYFVFTYLVSKESISLFYRVNHSMVPGKVCLFIHRSVMKKHRKTLLKYNWAINWPLYLLIALGFALGSYIGFIYNYSASAMLTFGVIVSLFISFTLFGSKYLANKEAIYEVFKEQYLEEENLMKEQYQLAINELREKLEEEDKKNNSEES